MNKKVILIVIAIIVTLILCTVGYFLLPDVVTTQIGNNPTHMSKIPAIALPLAVNLIFSYLYIKDEASSAKNLVLALLGPLIMIVMLIINLK